MFMDTPRNRRRWTLGQWILAIVVLAMAIALLRPITTVNPASPYAQGMYSARELFRAYQNYQLQKGPVRYGAYHSVTAANYADNHGDFALILMREGYLDSAMYFYIPRIPVQYKKQKLKRDPLIPRSLPKMPAQEKNGVWTVNPDFANHNISFEIALGIGIADTNSQVPIIWSRGLQPNGTWSEDSPYGSKFGILVRLNGSVESIRNIGETPHPLYRIQSDGKPSTEPTMNVYEAIPQGREIGVIGKAHSNP